MRNLCICCESSFTANPEEPQNYSREKKGNVKESAEPSRLNHNLRSVVESDFELSDDSLS